MQANLSSSLTAIQQYIQTLPSVTTLKPSTTSSTSSSSIIQQENKILTYELSLLHFIVKTLGISESCELYSNCKNLQDSEILRNNIKELNGKITKLSKECIEMKKEYEKVLFEKQTKVKENEILEKNASIYEKKLNEYDKMGGTTTINTLKDKIKHQSLEYQQLLKENNKCKQQIKKLTNRCQILEDLNTETETNICQLLLDESKSISKYNSTNSSTLNSKCVSKSTNKSKEENKENDSNIVNADHGNNKIQLMALKEEIKQLKNKVHQLEVEKDNQRLKYENKEKILSQIMSKSNRSEPL